MRSFIVAESLSMSCILYSNQSERTRKTGNILLVEFEIAAPKASALVESLRGVGYSTATALSDLIDNSISAGAQNIWLTFRFDGPNSWISLLDDGEGMNESLLGRAMVLGATSPNDKRAKNDLGRFGLGLKTASFSQCRNLTVASSKNNVTSIRRWDLDYICQSGTDEWRLLKAPRSGSAPLLEPLSKLTSGTFVLWEVLDRITGRGELDNKKAEDAFHEVIELVEEHLALVFHRYLEGSRPKLHLSMNGQPVKPWDPFMSSHPATEPTPSESIQTLHGLVVLQGFVLPHNDRLSEKVNRLGGGSKGWAAQQGFYVYRSNRLLVSGGWLGMGTPRPWTMEEPFRLARLMVEFTNEADEAWKIDIKKSVARPPQQLRSRMTELAEVVRNKARRVFAHRGSYGARTATEDLVPAWNSRSAKGGYRINRKHPVIASLLDGSIADAKAFDAALKVIESTVPVERIWLDTAEQGEVSRVNEDQEMPPALLDVGLELVTHWSRKIGMTSDQALARLSATDPFQNYPLAVEQIGQELFKGKIGK